MQSEITLKSPIFALYVLNDFVIVASGGGNAKFGVKNTLQCFQFSSSGISASPVFSNLSPVSSQPMNFQPSFWPSAALDT